MSKTSNESKTKYNKKSYQTHIFTVRKDDELNDKINEYKATNKSLSELIRNFLKEVL
jgi:hypothetical protein